MSEFQADESVQGGKKSNNIQYLVSLGLMKVCFCSVLSSKKKHLKDILYYIIVCLFAFAFLRHVEVLYYPTPRAELVKNVHFRFTFLFSHRQLNISGERTAAGCVFGSNGNKVPFRTVRRTS